MAVFGLASRAADGARLWLIVAAVLATTGRRFGRRAASRGVLALTVAELVAGAAKLVARRPRQRRRPAAFLARRTTPTSGSMPSAHSAAAFAFATGAASELPALAVPLAAAASVVSYSRIGTGHHRRSEVV